MFQLPSPRLQTISIWGIPRIPSLPPFCPTLSCFLSVLSSFSLHLSLNLYLLVFLCHSVLGRSHPSCERSFSATQRDTLRGDSSYSLKQKSPKRSRRRVVEYKQIIVGGTLIVLLMCFAANLFQALVPGRKIN